MTLIVIGSFTLFFILFGNTPDENLSKQNEVVKIEQKDTDNFQEKKNIEKEILASKIN